MSPQSEDESAELVAPPEYSPEERGMLLQLAHRAIASAFDGERLDLTPPSEHLAEMRGAFTTLHLNGKLRGCIGYVVPTQSLYRTVAETARAAAFDDPRFSPVTADEAAESGDRDQRAIAAAADRSRRDRGGPAWVGDSQGASPRVVAAASSCGVGMGPGDVFGPNLQKGWVASRCVGARC